ncbi:hypothetical protein SAMN05444162_0724 [Paenibacillaceae bacterium GAS479]|nr:hypothetical protein SAMN05444162_0724 [Paenibacillaceae bacterium GAS479]
MRKVVLASLMILVLLSGCTTPKPLVTEHLNSFKSKVLSEHKEITNLKIQMKPTRIEFDYYLKQKSDQDKDMEIFLKTKELILSPNFKKTTIEEKFFKEYSEDDKRYPDIFVRFFSTKKDQADYEYRASYYGPGIEGREGVESRSIDDYKTWYFDNFKSLPEPITTK